VILHGTAESSHSHIEIAEALADAYTVCLPDRRGRGLSGSYGVGYGVAREVEDLNAILTKTGAHDVFGVSVWAIVALHAIRTLSSIHNLAVFEPPFILNESPSSAFLARSDREIAEGNGPAAMRTGNLRAEHASMHDAAPATASGFDTWCQPSICMSARSMRRSSACPPAAPGLQANRGAARRQCLPSGTGLLAAGLRALLPAIVPRLPAPGRAHQAPLTFRLLRNGR